MKVVTWRLPARDRRETLRYLGYAGVKSTDGMEWLLDECEALIMPVLAPKAVYAPFPLEFLGEERMNLGFATVNSHSLFLNLSGCKSIVLFAATVGAGVDRLIAKYNRLSPARAAVLQAMGAAAVEQAGDVGFAAQLRHLLGAGHRRNGGELLPGEAVQYPGQHGAPRQGADQFIAAEPDTPPGRQHHTA